jgi:hypothetical protein
MIDNQALDKKIDIPSDTFSVPFSNILKSPQKSVARPFLPENQ